METLLELGTKVALETSAEGVLSHRRGVIAGYSTLELRVVYLVRLEEGFFTPEKDFYISTMVCDPSVVQPIA